MKKYILSIDQGTTSTRAILFDQHGKACFQSQREIRCFFPHTGWVEQDPNDIWVSVIDVVNEILVKSNETFEQIAAMGITNQRETTIIWDKKTGRPVYNAIVWQSKQSQEICAALLDKEAFIHQKTGLRINPYFSALKIRFILDQIPNGQERAEKGELLFGTVDSWLLYKLTLGKVHATDVSNASRTMLYNIFSMDWDEELLSLFSIPRIMLPQVEASSHLFGYASFFHAELPISAIAGDQQAALFGQVCFQKGDLKNTYGTGCFLLMNIGEKPTLSSNGLLTTVAWKIGDQVTYALEGSVFVAGAAVQWLRDQMKMIKDAPDSERCALEANTKHSIYVVPAFVGLGTPYWDDNARGAVFNLTRATTKYDFVKATLDSIAYQSRDVIEVMKEETGVQLSALKVDGGATSNGYLMQTQADLLRVPLHLPPCLEVTALGVCYLAGLNVGFYQDLSFIQAMHECQKTYLPKDNKEEMERKYANWKKAVEATRMFK